MAAIYPSLSAADIHTIDKLVKQLEPFCPGFHIDIMDNKFVPYVGISIEKTNSVAKLTYRQIWVHLAVEDPESYVGQLQMPADSILTFHIESNKNTERLIKIILEKKWLPGIAINPKTTVDEIFPYLDQLYQVLIMSVEPGAPGQQFLERTLAKIDPLVGYRNTSNLKFKIAMDGGINAKNIGSLVEKGVDHFAIGTEIVAAKVGPVEAYKVLTNINEGE